MYVYIHAHARVCTLHTCICMYQHMCILKCIIPITHDFGTSWYECTYVTKQRTLKSIFRSKGFSATNSRNALIFSLFLLSQCFNDIMDTISACVYACYCFNSYVYIAPSQPLFPFMKAWISSEKLNACVCWYFGLQLNIFHFSFPIQVTQVRHSGHGISWKDSGICAPHSAKVICTSKRS